MLSAITVQFLFCCNEIERLCVPLSFQGLNNQPAWELGWYLCMDNKVKRVVSISLVTCELNTGAIYCGNDRHQST